MGFSGEQTHVKAYIIFNMEFDINKNVKTIKVGYIVVCVSLSSYNIIIWQSKLLIIKVNYFMNLIEATKTYIS